MNDKNETRSPRTIIQNDTTYTEDPISCQYRVCTNKRGEFISGPYSPHKDPFMEVTSWEGTYRHVWPIKFVGRKINLVDLNTDQNNRPLFLFNSDNETGKESLKSFARLRGHEENDILEITMESEILPKRIVHLENKRYLLLFNVEGKSDTMIVEMRIVDREKLEPTKDKATGEDDLKKVKQMGTKSGSILKLMVILGIICTFVFPIFISSINAIVHR